MVARAEILNETNVGWSETSYWGGLSLVKYVQGRRVMYGRGMDQRYVRVRKWMGSQRRGEY